MEEYIQEGYSIHSIKIIKIFFKKDKENIYKKKNITCSSNNSKLISSNGGRGGYSPFATPSS